MCAQIDQMKICGLHTDKQQAKAKMPAAGATQALSAVCHGVGCNTWGTKTEDARGRKTLNTQERMPRYFNYCSRDFQK